MPEYQMANPGAKAIAASQSAEVRDVGCGVKCGSGAALPGGSARPPTRDNFAASPKMPALCQQQTWTDA